MNKRYHLDDPYVDVYGQVVANTGIFGTIVAKADQRIAWAPWVVDFLAKGNRPGFMVIDGDLDRVLVIEAVNGTWRYELGETFHLWGDSYTDSKLLIYEPPAPRVPFHPPV